MKESKGKEKEYFERNVARLQRDLEHTKANEKSKALEIQKLKKSRKTAERQQREMERKQAEENKKIKKNCKKNMIEKQSQFVMKFEKKQKRVGISLRELFPGLKKN